MQQNSKYRQCGDRDKIISLIISECSKLAQRDYKTRHNWVGKVIHWEMCTKFKFDHSNKWYMHNPPTVLENDTHILLWDFEIKTYHLTLARRSDPIIINKKRVCKIVHFAFGLTIEQNWNNVKRRISISNLQSNWKKKLWNMKVTIIPILIEAFGTVTKGSLKRLEEVDGGGRVESIQTTTLLRTARILRRIPENWGHLLSLKLKWKTIC